MVIFLELHNAVSWCCSWWQHQLITLLHSTNDNDDDNECSYNYGGDDYDDDDDYDTNVSWFITFIELMIMKMMMMMMMNVHTTMMVMIMMMMITNDDDGDDDYYDDDDDLMNDHDNDESWLNIPLIPEAVLEGGECCTTVVPPDNRCSLLCWSKSKISSGGISSTDSCWVHAFKDWIST